MTHSENFKLKQFSEQQRAEWLERVAIMEICGGLRTGRGRSVGDLGRKILAHRDVWA
jgi:hypothetical protein